MHTLHSSLWVVKQREGLREESREERTGMGVERERRRSSGGRGRARESKQERSIARAVRRGHATEKTQQCLLPRIHAPRSSASFPSSYSPPVEKAPSSIPHCAHFHSLRGSKSRLVLSNQKISPGDGPLSASFRSGAISLSLFVFFLE